MADWFIDWLLDWLFLLRKEKFVPRDASRSRGGSVLSVFSEPCGPELLINRPPPTTPPPPPHTLPRENREQRERAGGACATMCCECGQSQRRNVHFADLQLEKCSHFSCPVSALAPWSSEAPEPRAACACWKSPGPVVTLHCHRLPEFDCSPCQRSRCSVCTTPNTLWCNFMVQKALLGLEGSLDSFLENRNLTPVQC